MPDTVVERFVWGERREIIKPKVMAREAAAVKELGGPVVRTSKFLEGGKVCEFTWRRAPE